MGAHGISDGQLAHALVVLGGHHDRVDAHRAVVVVGERDLCLAVGAKTLNDPLLAHVGEALGEAVGEPDRCGHEIGRVGARVAEHDALVAGPQAIPGVRAARTAHFEGLVDAACNVGALTVEGYRDSARSPVKAHARGVVADGEDLPAYDFGNLHVGLGRDLTGDVNEAGRSHCFDGDARTGVHLEQSVQDRIGDAVAHLIGVAFSDGLGREKLLTHRFRLSRKAAARAIRPAATSSFEPT